MINNDTSKEKEQESTDQPNESTGIYVRGFVRISDPETGQVLVETNN